MKRRSSGNSPNKQSHGNDLNPIYLYVVSGHCCIYTILLLEVHHMLCQCFQTSRIEMYFIYRYLFIITFETLTYGICACVRPLIIVNVCVYRCISRVYMHIEYGTGCCIVQVDNHSAVAQSSCGPQMKVSLHPAHHLLLDFHIYVIYNIYLRQNTFYSKANFNVILYPIQTLQHISDGCMH